MKADRPPATGEAGDVWNDPKTPGLRLRYFATKSVWYLYYRTKAGKQRNMKLGDVGLFTLTSVRDRARVLLVAVAEGKDPAGDLLTLGERPNMAQLADWHIDRHVLVKNKASSREKAAKKARRVWDKDVLPRIGKDTAVADVTEAQCAEIHHAMRNTPIQANRVMAQIKKAFNLCEKWGWRPKKSNPVTVEMFPENSRKRFPEGDEPIRLMMSLERERAENPYFVAMIELVCLTGCRVGEIRTARKAWVLDVGLRLPDSKSGWKMVPLSTFSRAVINELDGQRGNPFLIPGKKPKTCLVGYAKMWERVLKRAGIQDLHVHDLRRFFASGGLSMGASLDAIGRVLGHAKPETTMRYAFLMTDAATATAEAAAKAVAERLKPPPKVEAPEPVG